MKQGPCLIFLIHAWYAPPLSFYHSQSVSLCYNTKRVGLEKTYPRFSKTCQKKLGKIHVNLTCYFLYTLEIHKIIQHGQDGRKSLKAIKNYQSEKTLVTSTRFPWTPDRKWKCHHLVSCLYWQETRETGRHGTPPDITNHTS